MIPLSSCWLFFWVWRVCTGCGVCKYFERTFINVWSEEEWSILIVRWKPFVLNLTELVGGISFVYNSKQKTKNKNLSTHSSFFQLQFKWKLKASTHCISRSSGSLALKVLCKRCEIEWSVLHCRTKIEVKWRYTNRYPQIKTRTGLEALTCRWGEVLLLGQLRSQVRTITSSNHLLPASRQPLHHTCTQPGPGSSAPQPRDTGQLPGPGTMTPNWR